MAEKPTFLEKVKGFLLKPKSTFEAVKEEKLGQAYLYFIEVLILAWIFSLAALAIIGTLDILQAVGSFISALFGIFIFGLWQHLWVWILGGRGLVKTFRIVMYSYTPAIVFQALYVGIAAVGVLFLATGVMLAALLIISTALLLGTFVWYVILVANGVQVFFNFKRGRAIGAAILGVALPIMLMVGAAVLTAWIATITAEQRAGAEEFTERLRCSYTAIAVDYDSVQYDPTNELLKVKIKNVGGSDASFISYEIWFEESPISFTYPIEAVSIPINDNITTVFDVSGGTLTKMRFNTDCAEAWASVDRDRDFGGSWPTATLDPSDVGRFY